MEGTKQAFRDLLTLLGYTHSTFKVAQEEEYFASVIEDIDAVNREIWEGTE